MQGHPFPETYRRYVAPVRAKCRRMLGSGAAAEDVVQETFVRLWRSGPSLEGADPGTVVTWLYRTSTRLAIDVLRERQRRSTHDVLDERGGDLVHALPCGGATKPDDVAAARSALGVLCSEVPEDELEAVILARIDGLSFEDVAMVLSVSERTVRRMLDRFDERTATMRKELVS